MSSPPRLSSLCLRIRDLHGLLDFYQEAIGLHRRQQPSGAVALGAGTDAPPLLYLEEAPDAPARSRAAAGLFHMAIRLPDRPALARALRRLDDGGDLLRAASDHGVSEALYLRDPEGNGIEIYRDRPRSEWTIDEDDKVRMDTLPLDLDELRAAADVPEARVPEGTDLGHVHLEARELAPAEKFCREVLDLSVRARQTGAAFLAWGEYHHHVAFNTWYERREPAPTEALGLAAIRLELATADDLQALFSRARRHDGTQAWLEDDELLLVGPDDIRWECFVSG